MARFSVILFVAAMPREFTGLLKCCRDVRPEKAPVRWARSGVCCKERILAVANGTGAEHAAAGVVGTNLRAVCNIGFCGALEPSLRVGDIVVATHVNNEPVCLPRFDERALTGRIASIDHMARTAGEKRALYAAGSVAVEMEAAGVWKRSRLLNVPFYCVRVVSDLASETLHCDFDGALRDDGKVDAARLLWDGLRHPTTCLPELLRFGKRAALASERLGAFLSSCEFPL